MTSPEGRLPALPAPDSCRRDPIQMGKKPKGGAAELDITAWATEFNFVEKYVYYLEYLNNSNFISRLLS